MTRQVIHIKDYWKVIAYYDMDYDFFDIVAHDLNTLAASGTSIRKLYKTMRSGKAKAFTLSNKNLRTSVVGFNRHNGRGDYINSIVHEAEHIKQDMLEAYGVDDKEEPPAYTIGYIVQQMFKVFKHLC